MAGANSLGFICVRSWLPSGCAVLAYSLARDSIAALLLISAGLKIDELAKQPTIGTGIIDARELIFALAVGELFLASWLLSSLFERFSRVATAICFGLFSLASACELAAGKASCGCFGKVHVPPAYTLALDLAIFVLSFTSCLTMKSVSASMIRSRNVIAGTIFMVGATAAIASTGRFTTTEQRNVVDRWTPGALVVLEPDKWIGKAFPLIGYIDIGDRLQSGHWKVVLYHDDCSSCQAAVPRFAQMVRAGSPELNGAQVALIEMPEYAAEGQGLVSADSPCIHGRLRADQDWFAQTPLVVDLDAGIVTHSASGD